MLRAISIALVLAQLAVGQCAAPYPVSLCCQYLDPYSEISYLMEDVCDVYVDNESILVGTMCGSNLPCTAPEYDGFYDVCCSSALLCGGGVDGAIGLNCTGTEVE